MADITPFPRRPCKPLVGVQPDNKIAVYIGSAYEYLAIAQAIHLRNQLNDAIDTALNRELPEVHS